MSDQPLNPAEAARVLWEITDEIDTHTKELVRLRLALPKLSRAFRVKYAEAYLSTDGSIAARQQQAALASDEAKFALEVNDQLIEARKDSLKSLHARLDVGRAINANLKEELRTFQSTQGMAA